MIDKIKAWFTSHSADAHYLAAAISFLFLAYFQLSSFHDYVNHVFGLFPQAVKELVSTIVALVFFYRNTRKAA